MHVIFGWGVAGGNRAYPSHLVRLQAVVQPVARLLESGSEHRRGSQKGATRISPLQNGGLDAVETILASRNGTRIGVPPENVVLPPIWQSAEGDDAASDPRWSVGGEPGAGMVGVEEILIQLTVEVALKP